MSYENVIDGINLISLQLTFKFSWYLEEFHISIIYFFNTLLYEILNGDNTVPLFVNK